MKNLMNNNPSLLEMPLNKMFMFREIAWYSNMTFFRFFTSWPKLSAEFNSKTVGRVYKLELVEFTP